MTPHPTLLTRREAGRVLCMSDHLVRRLVADGTLPSVPIGPRVYLRRDAVVAYARTIGMEV